MTTWNEIIDLKLANIQAAQSKRTKQKKTKKNIGCLAWTIGILIGLYGLSTMFQSEEPSFKDFAIGQDLSYRSEFGNIELYQLGERKLSQTEQKETEYKKTTAPQFERTNTISEKYFLDNNTNEIGKILDTIPMDGGHLWLKVKLESEIYNKPINFDLLSDEFTEKLKIEKTYIMTENLKKDFYVRLCNVDKGE